MVLLTLCILSVGLIGCCNCSQLPSDASSTFTGDNVVVLCLLAAFGTVSLIGACAFCFRRKKTFEKLENEAGGAENVKKNEYPIFRALATDGANDSSAIVPSERNHLSRDNLLNSSDNLAADDGGSSPGSDAADSSDIVLIEKASAPSIRDRTQPTSSATRDTITYETEKDIKKHLSPSSSTPLLYANNVQSYQHAPPASEQLQQKSPAVILTPESPFKDFYEDNAVKNEERLDSVAVDETKQDFMVISISEESKEESSVGSLNTNPFFNSINATTIAENQTTKDDASEVESSVNDNSEKYQILDEETDGEEGRAEQDWDDSPPPMTLQRQDSRSSHGSAGDKNSIEEALRALDIAIGSEDDGEDSDAAEETQYLDEIKEEAKVLVDSIVNDCEMIVEEKTELRATPFKSDDCFVDFCSLNNENMSTPCAPMKIKTTGMSETLASKALFPDGLDISDINDETFKVSPAADKTFDVQPVNDKTFELPAIKIDKEENVSEDLTTVTPVNTPNELSYSSETWDKMTNSKGAISKQPLIESFDKTVTLGSDSDTITFNQDGWYLHPKIKSETTFDVSDLEEEEDNMEDMSSTYDQLRRQLTEMLPHAQGMSQHNDFLDDDDLNKDSSSPSENYGIKYGDLDEASNAGSFELIGALINPEPPATNELHINYKRPLSPIIEESECDETCRTFIFNNETKLLDSTSTGIMESASAEAQMGQMPKTLMASNDTLFNFEDTLSDQTDNLLMSPRMNTAGSSGSSTLSRQESNDKISLERTPTNEDPPKINDMFKSQELDAIDIVRNSIRQHPLNLDLSGPSPSTSKYEASVAKLALEDGSWPLELPEAQQIINDLSSPEQNKTADSLSFEQDITYTIDDQKTCVSLILKNDDERISEISEPLFASESLDFLQADDDDDYDKLNSLQMDDIVSIDLDDNFNFEINDENGNQDCETKEMELTLNVQEAGSAIFDNDSINPESDNTLKKGFENDSLEAENKILADEIEADSIPISQATTKSVYSNDSINTLSSNTETVQSDKESGSNPAVIAAATTTSESSDDGEGNDEKKKIELKVALASDKDLLLNQAEITFHELHMAKLTTFDFFKQLTDMHDRLHEHCGSAEFACNKHHFMNSGDDDEQWGSQTDIRQVSCSQVMMTTSFTKEWSDDDSSHSSEEFMYVKGGVEGTEAKSDDEGAKEEQEPETRENQKQPNEKSSENAESVDGEMENVTGSWKKHKDHIPATPIFHGDEPQIPNESEDESAEEGDFTPSCWNQSLQPKRSSLKSPEKEAAEAQKKSRRVAFKTQRYHSVYEYPCEVVQLSPSYSEPQLWSNYMDDCSGSIDYFTYSHQLNDVATIFPQQIDGFSVSSSSRPFHSANTAQLHNTWPNDATEFSWSQIQDLTDSEDTTKHLQFPLKIEWPNRKSFGFDEDDSDERPDSGVGESSDSPSMGELCHVKGSLRLPLELVSSTSSEVSDFMSDHGITKEQEAITIEITNDDDESLKQPKSLQNNVEDDESDKMILPTPSCTGSMDSLSSNSGSSNSERGPPSFTTFGKDSVTKESDVSGRTSIIFIEDEIEVDDVENQKNVRNIDPAVTTDDKYILTNKIVLTVGSSDEDSGFENISRMAIK